MRHFFDIETTGLNPFDNQILTIQWKSDEDFRIWKVWESDEKRILEEFLDFLDTVSGNHSIFGYNCLKFDVPFIVERLRHHGLFTPEIYRLIHDKKWFDLYQFQGDNYVSMDRWLDSYGISRSCPVRGRDIPILFRQGKFKEIENHAVDDLVVCEKLVDKLREGNEDVFG